MERSAVSLQQSVQDLPGIGPRRTAALGKLGILTVRDLLFHVPRDYQDRRHVTPIAEGVTDADGRLALGPERLEDGTYTLTFSTGAYFAARGVETFYPAVLVTFSVDGDRHYHVPLLLSPFAYSTYRGS